MRNSNSGNMGGNGPVVKVGENVRVKPKGHAARTGSLSRSLSSS